MNDDEIQKLFELLQTRRLPVNERRRAAWVNGGEIKEIRSVVPFIKTGDEEDWEPSPCGILVEGGWIALVNVDPSEIFEIKPVFPLESEN